MSGRRENSSDSDSDWVEVERVPLIISFDDSDDLSQPTSPFIHLPLHEPYATTEQGLGSRFLPSETTTTDWEIRQNSGNMETESSTSKGQLPSLSTSESVLGRQEDTMTTTTDPATNPRDFHRACCGVKEFLATVTELACDLGASRISSISRIYSVCQQLLTQAEELEKISESFFNHWVSNGSKTPAVDIPLGPDLCTLAKRLSAQLMQTHGERREFLPIDGSIASLEARGIPL
ncbi:hypothetical protein ACKRZS_003600 [Fusarium odoratissimum]|nr:uncharacterized protein FOIG_01660 [Fusarium odoratissimum NRRL 54006]EXM08581.1 hypothetical protein FOIG_01660 [Fusarium odoratissimum NRRL 54006]KAK2127738.1 hypothetical protein NOF04DRAFT_8085 [Fusarium oxysporum II5]